MMSAASSWIEQSKNYDIEKVIECLSEDRLRPYYMFIPEVHQKLAVIPYDWLQALASYLFIPLQYLEITLRNKVHNALTSFYEKKGRKILLPGTSDEWITWMPSNPLIRRDVELARKNAKSEISGRPVITGDIISRLQFGVWIRILEEYPSKAAPFYFWDFTVQNIFPNAPDRSRKVIINEMRGINVLRNRLFHYEPIWKYKNMPNFQQGIAEMSRKFREIMSVVKWMSLDMYNFIKSSGHESRLGNIAVEVHNFLSAVEEGAIVSEKYKRNAAEDAIMASEHDDDTLLEREISEFRATGRPLDAKDMNLLKKKYGEI
jgi:hypothetical protein